LLLGDRGNDTILGISDVNLGYSLVKDFNRNEDKLILVGTKDLYTIGSLPANVPQGVAIFKLNTDGSQQLLAVVQGNISSTLDSSEYVFF